MPSMSRRSPAKGSESRAVSRAFQVRLTELETLLASTLGEDPYVSFEQLKEPLLLPEFRPPPELIQLAPPPREDDFLPAPPSGLSALAPGRKRAQAAAVAEAQAAYASALAEHAQAERRRQELLACRPAEGCRRLTQPNSIPSPASIPSKIFSTLTATNSRS